MISLHAIVTQIYLAIQFVLAQLFSPSPPKPRQHLPGPRIAVIGAGISGVSAAAHCVGHGFEVTIFESQARDHLGGIWSQVNNTSSLQIHSVMYRFHPSIRFRKTYPDRQSILREVRELWKRYRLDERTQFDVRIESVWKDDKTGKWVIQDRSYGLFDAVVPAVGTCGEPKLPHIPGQENFKGAIYHSSDLTGKDVKGKKMVVIGGGASAVEAVEFGTHQKAFKTTILARSDKWIIPRNPFVDGLLALNISGEETELGWIPEKLLKKFFYRDLQDLAPAKSGLYTETPMVNDEILEQIRSGQVQWLRGDIKKFEENAILFNHRDRGVPKGGIGREERIEADICVMATGFHRPSLHFLPDDAFDPLYSPPNWFLQSFPIGHPDICALNCTYVNAIGTVGNIHIGLYTRMLLMFLADPSTKPSPARMRVWVDWTRAWKTAAPGGPLGFFTYSELVWWFIFSLAISPRCWTWAPFVLFGFGSALPEKGRA